MLQEKPGRIAAMENRSGHLVRGHPERRPLLNAERFKNPQKSQPMHMQVMIQIANLPAKLLRMRVWIVFCEISR